MSIGLAFRVFFEVLFRPEVAAQVRKVLQATSRMDSDVGGMGEEDKSQSTATLEIQTLVPRESITRQAKRSDALTLLSTLQREARFLDLVSEPLETFEDVQIGAAAREVIRDCRKALDRMFGIEPLSSAEEGTSCLVPSEQSALSYRVVGKASQSPASGTVMHRGWRATRCQMPTWTGAPDESLILAPIEIEVS